MNYSHKEIEPKWQKKWKNTNAFKTIEDRSRPKFYILDMFPYPSGDGLHVGHPKGYIATDVYARFKELSGFSVLHPMGWDAFGLPAENYALKNKVHPEISTNKNIARYKEQLAVIGFNHDWEREINTTDPAYYKWTQWAFMKMYNSYYDEVKDKAMPIEDLIEAEFGHRDYYKLTIEQRKIIDDERLAVQSYEPINWCPSCKTGLANEDLEDGKCERCGSEIEQKPLRQWVLKITKYADRMLEGLNDLNWEDMIKDSQRNWIGRSEGAELDFAIDGEEEKLRVFTTRPDTLFGATYMVIAPEHPLVTKYENKINNLDKVLEYRENAKKKTAFERVELAKDKTGVKLEGLQAVNPVNNEKIEIWVSDYVMMGYGTGAIMAVPAHDERDYEFAKKYGIKIVPVIAEKFINSGKEKPKEGIEFEKRRTVNVYVKHWEENKIIYLDWKQYGWKSAVIGGIEEGEMEEEAAIRELKEETGYKNIKSIKVLDQKQVNMFYAPHKNVNRYSEITPVYIELEDGEKDEIAKNEKEIHTVHWIELDKAEEMMTFDNQKKIVNAIINCETPYTGDGEHINSGFIDGMNVIDAKKKMIEFLEEKGIGKKKVNYKIKDWVFSRQRYWGEPFPIIHCDDCGAVTVDEKHLPVELPKVENYEPSGTGESPLVGIADWVNVTCPVCGKPAKRETNTMPQWAGSNWYYLRYIDNKNAENLIDKEREKYWMNVDFYVGGAEHATRHLIYARFWHKFLYDIDVVSTEEPFKRLQHVGLVMAEDGRKMSKRYGNVVNPDEIVNEFGADTLRIYEMFMGDFKKSVAWSTNAVRGSRRFLDRVWNLMDMVTAGEGYSKDTESLVHKTIKKVGEDIEEFKFNTAIAQMMTLVNKFYEMARVTDDEFKTLLVILNPFVPHITEEMWTIRGYEGQIKTYEWPKYDKEKMLDDTIEIPIQVNGKLKAKIEIDRNASEAEVLEKMREEIIGMLEGKSIVKEIYVPGKIINVVVK